MDEGGEEENECAINYAGWKIWHGRVGEGERKLERKDLKNLIRFRCV